MYIYMVFFVSAVQASHTLVLSHSQSCQLSHIARETHTFIIVLTQTRIQAQISHMHQTSLPHGVLHSYSLRHWFHVALALSVYSSQVLTLFVLYALSTSLGSQAFHVARNCERFFFKSGKAWNETSHERWCVACASWPQSHYIISYLLEYGARLIPV